MESRPILLSILVLTFSTISFGLYLVTDYFMDPKFPKIFGQVCGKTIQDDCLWLNSHLNTFGIADYGSDRDCITTLDASDHPGSLYKLKWKRFRIESGDCSKDYLELFDAKMDLINSSTNLIGRFCGWTYPNITGYPTDQFLTFKWHTDGNREDKGFRVMATRHLPYPCADDFFHCKAENRCIDSRLKCDGVEQCDDGEDESSCTGWEKFIGAILALGTAGIVGVCGAVLFGCILIGCILCAVTCCRKPCGKCWKTMCKPCRSLRKPLDKKAAQIKEHEMKRHDENQNKSNEDSSNEADETDDKKMKPKQTMIPVSSAEVKSRTTIPVGDNRESTMKRFPSPMSIESGGKIMSSGLQSSEESKSVTKIDT